MSETIIELDVDPEDLETCDCERCNAVTRGECHCGSGACNRCGSCSLHCICDELNDPLADDTYDDLPDDEEPPEVWESVWCEEGEHAQCDEDEVCCCHCHKESVVC